MSKKTLTGIKLRDINFSDIDGEPIGKVVDYLQKVWLPFHPVHKNFRIGVDYSYDGAAELSLLGDRQETDEEYQKRVEAERIAAEKKLQRQQKAAEREAKKLEAAKVAHLLASQSEEELYKKLKEKYEPK